jgi:hypothetical protein
MSPMLPPLFHFRKSATSPSFRRRKSVVSIPFFHRKLATCGQSPSHVPASSLPDIHPTSRPHIRRAVVGGTGGPAAPGPPRGRAWGRVVRVVVGQVSSRDWGGGLAAGG